MTKATEVGQPGLQGSRANVADGIAEPLAGRTPLDDDQARALLGALFFALSVMCIVKTARTAGARR